MKHSEETKKKISISLSKYLKTHPDHPGLRYWKGKKMSTETKVKMKESAKICKNSGRFTKGFKPWNYGIPGASVNYKGSSGSICSFHSFLRKWFGHPKKCKKCGLKGKRRNNRWSVEWALKKGKSYSQNPKDYIHLCRKCHRTYDNYLWKRKIKK